MPTRVVYAATTAYVDAHTLIRLGQIWAADDPIVLEHPEFFTDDPAAFAHRTVPASLPVVEEATAEPGELRRGPGRPRKDGNGPWASGGDA